MFDESVAVLHEHLELIDNRILAYEPRRMIAIQIARPPESFPFKEAWKKPWTVVTLTDMGSNQTHVRIASIGFGTDKESISITARGDAASGFSSQETGLEAE